MKPRNVCLACRIVFEGESDPRIRLINQEGQEVSRADVPEVDSEEFHNSATDDFSLVCPQDHLLIEDSATRPLIVMALFGETRSGKDAFQNGLISVLENHGLFSRQFTFARHPLQVEAYAASDPLTYLAEQTQAATFNQKRVPLYITLAGRGGRDSDKINVALFNTGGEDNNVLTGRKLLKPCPFIPLTDVFVLMIPPPALPGLPAHVRTPPGSEGENTQSLKVTLGHIQRIGEAIGEARKAAIARALKAELPPPPPPEEPIVVFALTKCDRYVGLDGFPQETLLERRHEGATLDALDIAMFNEQEALYDFVVNYGGSRLFEAAADIGGKVFITAISGTGSDKEGRAAKQQSAVNRCLDPLLLPLMRAGRGRMTLADIEAR